MSQSAVDIPNVRRLWALAWWRPHQQGSVCWLSLFILLTNVQGTGTYRAALNRYFTFEMDGYFVAFTLNMDHGVKPDMQYALSGQYIHELLLWEWLIGYQRCFSKSVPRISFVPRHLKIHDVSELHLRCIRKDLLVVSQICDCAAAIFAPGTWNGLQEM